ncbi:hypothetical protein C8J57DRAFT_1277493 [Mycena rebaudengoi]|nr:hypothetical protein C8J57DRAFT_1277493 [Mycena rebaudengoi]
MPRGCLLNPQPSLCLPFTLLLPLELSQPGIQIHYLRRLNRLSTIFNWLENLVKIVQCDLCQGCCRALASNLKGLCACAKYSTRDTSA